MKESEERFREASLTQSEAWYKALIRESTDMIDVLDRDGNYIYVNPSRYLDIGIEPEELIGTCCWDAVHPEDMPAVQAAFSQILQNPGKPVPVTIRIFLPDDTYIYLEVIGRNLLDDPAVGGIVINSRDVTERKLAEAKLREAAVRDRLLGEIAAHIRQSLNVEEVLRTTVEEVRQFLQTDRVLIKRIERNQENKQVCKVVAKSINPRWLSHQEGAIRDESYTQEIIALFKDRDFQAVEDVAKLKTSSNLAQYLNMYQIKAAVAVSIVVDEHMYGILMASHCSSTRCWQQLEIDFLRSLATQVAIAIKQGQLYQQTTQLNQQLLELNANLEKQVEERTVQLQQKMLELQELSRVKDIFLHAVSHDLRTPVLAALMVLNNLLKSDGSAQMAAERSDFVPVARSVLARMAQSSDRQLNLINSLLEIHSTKMQGVIVNCSPLKLSQFVLAIVTDLEPIVAKNKAVLTNLVSNNLPMVSADAIQLRRVFENLIINALKHNPPSIELTILATVEKCIGNTKLSKKELSNSSFEASGVESAIVRCVITDNGVGIKQEQCSRLFELYYQGGNTRRSTGIGLGLYLCKQILKAHGGEIGVESSLGVGTTFWFTLPLAQ
ncbi:MAG: ATP-binding protein [Coleofasciculaceae cyanobacterium]